MDCTFTKSANVWSNVATLVFVCACLVGAAFLGLFPFLLATLAADGLTAGLARSALFRKFGRYGGGAAATLVIALPLLGVTAATFQASELLADASSNIAAISDYLVKTAQYWRMKLPMAEMLTKSAPGLVSHIAAAGSHGAHLLVVSIAGVVVGALAGSAPARASDKPLTLALRRHAVNLRSAFTQILIAQLWIASINTVCTAVLLLGAMPVFGITFPYAKWLVILTFIAGLVPIAGNLLCNVVITLVALGTAPAAAPACLVFLIALHKSEYLINARVLGKRIETAGLEIIAAMVLFETLFGLTGLVAGPLYYAFLKLELREAGWI